MRAKWRSASVTVPSFSGALDFEEKVMAPEKDQDPPQGLDESADAKNSEKTRSPESSPSGVGTMILLILLCAVVIALVTLIT